MEKEQFIQWLQREIEHAQQSLKEIEGFEARADKGGEWAAMLVQSKSHYEHVLKTNKEILGRLAGE